MNEDKRSAYAAEDEIEIDLRQILAILKKWSKLIIVMTLLCAFSAGLISFFVLEPVYEAQTLLMVTQATDKLQAVPTEQEGNLDNVVGAVSRIPVWTMSTYLGQLQSEALMKKIIEELDLSCSPAGLAGMIDAAVVKDSNLIQVKVHHTDPVMASRIANTLSDKYLQLMTEKNQEQMSRSVAFLEEQKKLTDKDLQKAEEALKNSQSQPRGVAVLETEFAKKAEDAAEFSSRQQLAQVELQQLQAGVQRLEKDLSITPKTIMIEKWNEATGTAVTTQEVNPLYVSLAEQLAQKKAALAEKQGELEGLQYMSVAIQQDLDVLQAEMAGKKLENDKLQREVDRLNQTSDTLAQKGTETQIAKSIDLGDTSVIVVSEASIPQSPVKPNKKLNIAIAFVLGLMIFTLLAFILEHLDNTVKTPEDVTRELELPVLGVIPKMTLDNSRQRTYGG